MAERLTIMSLRMLHLSSETNVSCPDLGGQNYRASFHTHSSAKGPRKKIYHGHLDGKGPRRGEKAVVKMFRDAAGTEEMCDSEIEKHKLARRLAKKFNKTVPDEHYRIQFTLPLKSTVERLGMGFYLTRHKSRHMDTKEWVLIEENLEREGNYQLFIHKTGERLSKDPTTLDAFMHFVYNESEGHYLMCGFQGVKTENGYLLTTPCIHSTDKKFGSATDKGINAIVKVFKHHRCNNLCYSFLKPDPDLEVNDDEEDEEEDEKGSDISDDSKDEADDHVKDDNSQSGDSHLDLDSHGSVISDVIREADEETEEKEKSKKSFSLGLHWRDSKKKKEDKAHRSNVKAVGELQAQASF